MKRLIVLACVAAVTVGCSVRPSKISNTKDFAKSITYFKDSRTGLCFAGVATKKELQASQNGVGLACVPCKSISKELLE